MPRAYDYHISTLISTCNNKKQQAEQQNNSKNRNKAKKANQEYTRLQSAIKISLFFMHDINILLWLNSKMLRQLATEK